MSFYVSNHQRGVYLDPILYNKTDEQLYLEFKNKSSASEDEVIDLLRTASPNAWSKLVHLDCIKEHFSDGNCYRYCAHRPEIGMILYNHGLGKDAFALTVAILSDQWNLAEKLVNDGVGLSFRSGYSLAGDPYIDAGSHQRAWQHAVSKNWSSCVKLFQNSPKLTRDTEARTPVLSNPSENLLIELAKLSLIDINLAYYYALSCGHESLFDFLWKEYPRAFISDDLLTIVNGYNFHDSIPKLEGTPSPQHESIFKKLVISGAHVNERDLLSSCCRSLPCFIFLLNNVNISKSNITISKVHEWFFRFKPDNSGLITKICEARGWNLSFKDYYFLKGSKDPVYRDLWSRYLTKACALFPRNMTTEQVMEQMNRMTSYIGEVNLKSLKDEISSLTLFKKFVNLHYKRGLGKKLASAYSLPDNEPFALSLRRKCYPIFDDNFLRYIHQYTNLYGFKAHVYSEIYRKISEVGKQECDMASYVNVFKLSILFDNANEVDEYLEEYKRTHPHTKQPVHDACLFDLPSNCWDISTWKSLLKRNRWSPSVFNLLPKADLIEETLNGPLTPFNRVCKDFSTEISNDEKREFVYQFYCKELYALYSRNTDETSLIKIDSFNEEGWCRLPHSLKRKIWEWAKSEFENDYEWMNPQNKSGYDKAMSLPQFIRKMTDHRNIACQSERFLQNVLTKIYYRGIPEKWISFAKEATFHGISLDNIRYIINTIENSPKLIEFVPDLSFNESDWTVETMTSNDPTVYLAGKETGCCQYIGGLGRHVAVHAATSPFGRILRVMKGDKWIAQAWVGITTNQELVLDSIEANRGYATDEIFALFKKASQIWLEQHPYFKRVLLGEGGGSRYFYHKMLPVYEGTIAHIIGYLEGGYDSLTVRYVIAEQNSEQQKEDSADDYILVNAKDTYVDPGKPIRSLTSTYPQKVSLSLATPKATALLKNSAHNPIAEEGYYLNIKQREHYGELFLTHEAVEILANNKIFEKKDIDVRYQFHRLITINQSERKLIEELKKVPLHDELPTLILMTEGIHTVAAVVGKVGEDTVAYIADSEGRQYSPIYSALRSAYPESHVFINEIRLQKDYYGCSLFALKAAIYFAKHGRSLLRSSMNKPVTPPTLLKMSQGLDRNKFTKEALETVVSHRRDRTLEQYLNEMETTIHGTKYNTAVLRKKNKYIRLLERLLG